MFETVQTVTGIGPRLALAMLSVLPPDQLRAAVASNDLATLTKVPGVGRKGAERIVLELRDKLGPADAPRRAVVDHIRRRPRPGGRGTRRSRVVGQGGDRRGRVCRGARRCADRRHHPPARGAS